MANNSTKQNDKTPLASNHWTHRRPRHMLLEIQVLSRDSYKNMAELNRLMGSQPFSFDKWISKCNINCLLLYSLVFFKYWYLDIVLHSLNIGLETSY